MVDIIPLIIWLIIINYGATFALLLMSYNHSPSKVERVLNKLLLIPGVSLLFIGISAIFIIGATVLTLIWMCFAE